jgi:hypothetical protein
MLSLTNIYSFNTDTFKTRPICKKNNKYYGGMILCIRDEIKPGVTVLESNRLKLDKNKLKLEEDLYVGYNYILPQYSRYASTLDHEPTEEMEVVIFNYRSMGKVIIMGDLNGRTPSRSDFLEKDANIPMPDNTFYEIDEVTNRRSSQDSNIKPQGLRLLDICKARIL